MRPPILLVVPGVNFTAHAPLNDALGKTKWLPHCSAEKRSKLFGTLLRFCRAVKIRMDRSSKSQRGHERYKKKENSWKAHEKVKPLARKYDENSPVIQSFKEFQSMLDSRYDKRERIVKLSRDTTIISKRVIFQLHRFSDEEGFDKILSDAEVMVDGVRTHLEKIASELKAEDPYQFARAFTGGLQEFVEAVTFMHYIKENELLGYDDLCKKYLTFATQEASDANVLLTPIDYILGVADLTGELMRMSINYIGAGNHEKSHEICLFLREIHDQFLLFSGREFKDLKQKIRVLRQSLQKVENACYTLHIRGSEVPKHMLVDLIKMRDDSENSEQSVNPYDL